MAIVRHFPPKTGMEILHTDPMLFLGGPIQGAPDWQAEATQMVEQQGFKPTLHVANPRREYLDNKFIYEDQVNWEKLHIVRAAKYGAVLFWFAKQDPSLDYEEGRAYAQTSRVEFGRVCGWKDYARNLSLVIGIEPGYIGSERYFRSCAEEFDLPVHEDLASSVDNAMQLIAHRRY